MKNAWWWLFGVLVAFQGETFGILLAVRGFHQSARTPFIIGILLAIAGGAALASTISSYIHIHRAAAEDSAHSVSVNFTETELAAVGALAERLSTSVPLLLRESALVTLSDGPPPLIVQIVAWLIRHGWTAAPPGPGGAIWSKGETSGEDGVAVPNSDQDEKFTWGAVERIARHEFMSTTTLALEMMAITDEEVKR